MENIGLQDSLLSRFDLLFIVLDQMDPEQDREISDHVLRMHRYRNPNEQDGDGELLVIVQLPCCSVLSFLGGLSPLGDSSLGSASPALLRAAFGGFWKSLQQCCKRLKACSL